MMSALSRWSGSAAAAVVGLIFGATQASAAAPRSASTSPSCPAGVGYRVGVAKADITPTVWPVAEAAYSVGRLAYSAAHPFYARAMAVQSCATGATVVLTGIDSQGYFAAYKEDPVSTDAATGYGLTAIRLTAAAATGVPAADIVVAATHTHNSPDSVGVWAGGSTANNKAPYLERVQDGTVAAITAAVQDVQPATLRVGTADITSLVTTVGQVSNDPSDYPVDTALKVLQATAVSDCHPIATLVDASVHATVAGEIHGPAAAPDRQVIDPDWPGRVATDLESELPGNTAVVLAGAVGRTQPRFPTGTDPASPDPLTEVAAYGDVMSRRVGSALAAATPVAPGPVAAVDTMLAEEIEDPALVALFTDERGVPNQSGGTTVGGLMRSVLPPYSAGNVVAAEAANLRIGGLLLSGTPGEGYPEVSTELAARVATTGAPVIPISLADDQLGYTPPAFEYPFVALADGGDEGVFTINPHFGADLINADLAAARSLGFTTTGTEPYLGTGPAVPPDQGSPAPSTTLPEPAEQPLSLGCPAVQPTASLPEAPYPAALVALFGLGAVVAALVRHRLRLTR